MVDNYYIMASLGVLSKRYEEYFFRHLERFYICIDKSFWGTGLTRELISELVYLSLEDGKERVVIELLPDMNEHKKEIEELDFEQIAVLPEFFMDELGSKKDILIFANHLGNLWKSFEENLDLQFRPHIMED
ncbi:MAG: glutamate mutase L [Deltaproteobacteria bacterium]|nr:glutamate mutase L [Deltaproteobacteria bacterium]